MSLDVRLYEDAAATMTMAEDFLRSRPAHHNLILTLLDSRISNSEHGRYWLASRASKITGAAVQSDPERAVMLVPMEIEETIALADAIADEGIEPPGVTGDAATAASFAGRWTERLKSGATPTAGLRLYELEELYEIDLVEGRLRKAEEGDRQLAEAWVREFHAETRGTQSEPAKDMASWIANGRLWFWENSEVVSMLVARKPVVGVVRISAVYTPPEKRRRGYAAACVHAISKQITDAGLHCILYTDLANPTSNSIYRRIGYRAISEAIRYRFDAL